MANWSNDELIYFNKLISDSRLSFGDIAIEMSEHFHKLFSRSAIIGKANRMGITRNKPKSEKLKWNAEQREKLAHFVRAGLTHREIIIELEKLYGTFVSAKTISTMVEKLGLRDIKAQRKRENNVRATNIMLSQFEQHSKPVVQLFDEKPNPLSVHLLDAKQNACRWPVQGTGVDLICCGRMVETGSYCAHHTMLAYEPRKARIKNDERPLYRAKFNYR